MFAFAFRLQWKLTLAYAAVTVAVLGILIVTLLFITNTLTFNSPQMDLMMAQALDSAAAGLAPALEKTPPDYAAMDAWLMKTFHDSTVLLDSSSNTELGLSFSTIASQGTLLMILDSHGRVIETNQQYKVTNGKMGASQVTIGSELINQALNGETRPAQLLARQGNQHAAVAPIHNQNNQLVGIAYLLVQRPNALEMLWISIYSTLSIVVFLGILAILIGALFGALTARGLVKRLKRATQATAAWGQGNFTERINDKSRDEIGQLSRDLNKMADQLQALMRANQELAALEERNFLARELHDSAKQQVFATSMNLAAAKALWIRNPEEARKRLEIAAELSRQSQHELTTLVQTLRPAELDRQTLAQALTQAVRFWEKQNGITARCTIQEDGQRLPADTEQALFRVAQEALSNIARHSGANAAEISLSFTDCQFELNIRDNGHGFDIHQPVRGLGLRSMQERIQGIGGTFTLTSQPGDTSITVIIPFNDRSTDV